MNIPEEESMHPRQLSAPASILAATVALVAGAVPSTLTAQVAVTTLDQPEATFAEPFGSVADLLELPDGRIMVADGLGQALVVIDMATGSADTVGRIGQGPGEYKSPDGVFPLPADSTLLVDLGNGRLALMGPDYSLGETTPIAQDDEGGGIKLVLPRGTDDEGRVYFQMMPPMRPGADMPDSAMVGRWDRSTGAIDTVASVKLRERSRQSSGGRDNQNVRIMPLPLTLEDAWAVRHDGTVAVARSGEYHLEWIRPDGSIVSGPPVAYEPVSVKKADKEAWIEELSNGLSISVSVENGRRSTSFGRGGGPRDASPDDYEWPQTKPPFPGNAVWISSSGDAWVERYMPAGTPETYDVFGSDGALMGRVVLPAGAELVGFGKGAVFVVRRDDVDFQWLERYAL
jgi:hypothetical protein